MSTLRSLALGLACVAFCSIAHAEPRKKPRPGPPTVTEEVAPNVADCAIVHAEARMEAYGYSHIVVLENRCSFPVSCDVWTDVDPSPRNTLRAAPGESTDVLTRRGSPSRDVNAQKDCKRAS